MSAVFTFRSSRKISKSVIHQKKLLIHLKRLNNKHFWSNNIHVSLEIFVKRLNEAIFIAIKLKQRRKYKLYLKFIDD